MIDNAFLDGASLFIGDGLAVASYACCLLLPVIAFKIVRSEPAD